MQINLEDIRSLIKECAQELKESNSINQGVQSHKSQSLITGDESDPDTQARKWKEFTEACSEPQFRDAFLIPTLKRRPDIIVSMLEFVSEDEELQNEFYKSVKKLREENME